MTQKENPNPHESPQKPVPPSGSLGLLAYGYKGLLAWRAARNEASGTTSRVDFDKNKS